MKPPVLTKRDFVKRYARGEFGNASPTWDNYGQWRHSNPLTKSSLYHIRNRVAGGITWYNIEASKLGSAWSRIIQRGVQPESLYISEMAPTDKTIFQGEIVQSKNHLDLTYTTVAKPMRDAFAECTQHANGLSALAKLYRFLCPNSLEWMQYLLEEYPDHTIEFSAYACNWGTIPGYNTVFWEVRNY